MKEYQYFQIWVKSIDTSIWKNRLILKDFSEQDQ